MGIIKQIRQRFCKHDYNHTFLYENHEKLKIGKVPINGTGSLWKCEKCGKIGIYFYGM